jgi:non-heme chloroperoxidase
MTNRRTFLGQAAAVAGAAVLPAPARAQNRAATATHPVTPEVLKRWVDVALQASLGATVACVDTFSTTDFRGELAAANVPALVIHGTADIPVPLALARATAQRIKGAKLIEYDGVSHGLVVTERDRVTRDLLAFLAG